MTKVIVTLFLLACIGGIVLAGAYVVNRPAVERARADIAASEERIAIEEIRKDAIIAQTDAITEQSKAWASVPKWSMIAAIAVVVANIVVLWLTHRNQRSTLDAVIALLTAPQSPRISRLEPPGYEIVEWGSQRARQLEREGWVIDGIYEDAQR